MSAGECAGEAPTRRSDRHPIAVELVALVVPSTCAEVREFDRRDPFDYPESKYRFAFHVRLSDQLVNQILAACLAILAQSGIGKTMLIEMFRRDTPPIIHPTRGLETIPAPGITLTSRPSIRRIDAPLLRAVDAGIKQRTVPLAEPETRTLKVLKQVDVRSTISDS